MSYLMKFSLCYFWIIFRVRYCNLFSVPESGFLNLFNGLLFEPMSIDWLRPCCGTPLNAILSLGIFGLPHTFNFVDYSKKYFHKCLALINSLLFHVIALNVKVQQPYHIWNWTTLFSFPILCRLYTVFNRNGCKQNPLDRINCQETTFSTIKIPL